jgi:hypothetical protein
MKIKGRRVKFDKKEIYVNPPKKILEDSTKVVTKVKSSMYINNAAQNVNSSIKNEPTSYYGGKSQITLKANVSTDKKLSINTIFTQMNSIRDEKELLNFNEKFIGVKDYGEEVNEITGHRLQTLNTSKRFLASDYDLAKLGLKLTTLKTQPSFEDIKNAYLAKEGVISPIEVVNLCDLSGTPFVMTKPHAISLENQQSKQLTAKEKFYLGDTNDYTELKFLAIKNLLFHAFRPVLVVTNKSGLIEFSNVEGKISLIEFLQQNGHLLTKEWVEFCDTMIQLKTKYPDIFNEENETEIFNLLENINFGENGPIYLINKLEKFFKKFGDNGEDLYNFLINIFF